MERVYSPAFAGVRACRDDPATTVLQHQGQHSNSNNKRSQISPFWPGSTPKYVITARVEVDRSISTGGWSPERDEPWSKNGKWFGPRRRLRFDASKVYCR